MSKNIFQILFFSVAIFFSLNLFAITNVVIKATVVARPSCEVNNGLPIEVDFGDNIITSQVDGVQYAKEIQFNLYCWDITDSQMKVRFNGQPSSFDASFLETDKQGLGIKFTNSSGVLKALGDWTSFTYPSTPVFYAAPVKDFNARLSAGEFTASSTLEIEFL